ncbi:heavy-metal-associated domain-containing protein [Pseudomonas helleri]|uniref:Copper chaperone n=1 Tax=Pseudomonas helleri TaxID=1608996 RepID=A0A6L5I2E5_9PSED|nr:heavy-metal-associated domain-containing protein [Pseudomonas helleri]KMN21230.1 heavy metal transporter [Pseudomonas helleri]MQT76316.1 copper chaperone [Pseudomonas helleri]MQT96891.1 copper chaperone [Pseudomonas helleri]MQU08841.1 copper chaperone [Pseudomonas helleri]MQU34065.1 copper chaperone [Pseudomonas helleri]
MQTFTVDGMTCGGCVRGVTNAIQRLDPQSKVDVDLKTKTVKVDSSLAAKEIVRAIKDAGFDVPATA